MDVKEVMLTESDLFALDDKVDTLILTDKTFQQDGVLIFNRADDCGTGTSVEEFISKFGNFSSSLKRLNPICVPHSQDFYGHLAFSQEHLDLDELCTTISPITYSEATKNCCTSALHAGGVEGLLSHYFDKELKANAMAPPQFQMQESISQLKKRAAEESRCFKRAKKRVASLASPADKANELSRLLLNPKELIGEQPILDDCTCSLCTYSDVTLVEDDETGEINPSMTHTSKYFKGKGFMYASGIDVGPEVRNHITSNFSLSFLSALTLTCLLGSLYPGITSPYMYFGFIHSFFPIHIEDLSLWSINFLHHGYPKVWIVVSPYAVSKLQFFLSKEFTCPGHSTCLGLLGHKYHMPTPSWLTKHGIPFKVVVQRSGQGVIVSPNAAHFGFNLGPNIAEAINFGTKYWIPYGIVYPKCTCMLGQVHGNLSTIVSTFCPNLLKSYLEQKIPTVPQQPHFSKCIVHANIWDEALNSSCSQDIDHLSTLGETENSDQTQVGNHKVLLQPRGLKRTPNRKIVACPMCSRVYQGGQKQRLLDHIRTTHANLSQKDQERTDSELAAMFPGHRDKLPKKVCDKCGKAVARSMKAHQQSRACIMDLDKL